MEHGGIYLPAHMVTTGWGIPTVCVRDGRPAAVHRRVTFVSKTPLWVYLTLVVGWLITLVALLAIQKRIKAPAWPVCADCASRRRTRLTVMWVLLVGGPVLSVVLAGMASSPDPASDGTVAAILLLGIFGSLIAAAVVGSNGSWAVMFSAVVDPTGLSVNLRKPHPAFVQQLPGMQQPMAPPPLPVAAGPAAPQPAPQSWVSGPTILPGG